MKNIPAYWLSAITLFTTLFATHCYCDESIESNALKPSHQRPRTIEVSDLSSPFLNITLKHQECMNGHFKTQHCLLEMTAATSEQDHKDHSAGLEKLGGLNIQNLQDISPVIKGTLTLTTPQPVKGSSLSYVADLRELPEWVQREPELTTLMTSLHPVLLEQILKNMDQASTDSEASDDEYKYFLKPKLIPIPKQYKNRMDNHQSEQILQIDLGDHYTMLIRVNAQKKPVKVYIGDRLAWHTRAYKPYLRSILAIINGLELFHHIREFEAHAIDGYNLYAKPEARTKLNIASSGLGPVAHIIETRDHYNQIHEYTTPQDLLKEEESTTEAWMERFHLSHSLAEVATAYYYNLGTDRKVLRIAAAALATTNMLKDLLPQNFIESHHYRLLHTVMEKEFGIVLQPEEKDEL